MIDAQLITSLLLILMVAWVFGSIFARFGLPVMLGELLAGILLGPAILGFVQPSPALEILAELGIFFVMFHTGMEMDPKELLEHGLPSFAVALGGFIVPFGLGFAVTYFFGGTLYQSLFVGMGVSITAIAVQAVVLFSLRINQSEVGHIIMGAAIVDDILALICLSTLLGLAKSGSIHFAGVLIILLKVVGFFGLTILLGQFVMPRFTARLQDKGAKSFTFAMTSAFFLAYCAELAGLHLIIGAFLAGQFVRKEVVDQEVYKVLHDRFYGISYGFLLPIFFASLALHLHFSWTPFFITFALALTLVAIVGKLIGCGVGAKMTGYNNWQSLVIGFGMNGRGAVEMVVASVVLALGNDLLDQGIIDTPLLTQDQFSALIFMAFVTTILAPITLKWAVKRACRSDAESGVCPVD